MTRNQAYKILNLTPGASEADIRRAYKKLALKLHPDINPSPEANEEFIRLSQAMELLLLPEILQPNGSSELKKKRAAGETPEERKERMERARQRYEQQKQYKHRENTGYFTSLTSGRRWKIFNGVVVVSTVIACILLLDAFLPSRFEKDRLIAYSPAEYQGVYAHKITGVWLQHTGPYYARTNRGAWASDFPEVEVEKSFWLNTPLAFRSNDNFYVHKSIIDFHIGAVRWMLIPFLLIPLATRLRKRMRLTFVFFYHLSFWFVGTVCIYLIFTEDRLQHILTFGFL